MIPASEGRLRLLAAPVKIAAAAVVALSVGSTAIASSSPVADAGVTAYVARDPVRLDGTGSYDPDGDPIAGYRWTQVSGPEVVITGAETATPLVGGFVQTVNFLVKPDNIHKNSGKKLFLLNLE